MQQIDPRSRYLGAALLAAACLVPAPVMAQAAVGDPIPIIAFGAPSVVFASASDCAVRDEARMLGGTTLFGAAAPGGPVLGFLQQPAPAPIGDDPYCPSFLVNGPPPGTYYVAMVFGLVNTVSVPLSAWRQVVVPQGCTGVPNPPSLIPGQPMISGSNVSVGFGQAGGCSITGIEVEIGSAPGLRDLGTRPLNGLLSAASVPSGTYYLRARARNAAGLSRPSIEVPVRVPGPCAAGSLPQAPLNPAATVNGNVVTIAWTQSPGMLALATFYQIRLKNPSTQAVIDNILLPPTTSVTAAGVPPGTYQLQVISGNACGVAAPVTADVTFTVQ
jgi:hypothetical protein